MKKIKEGLKKVISSGHGFTLVLMFSVMAILFVLFRMRVVELGYKISQLNKTMQKEITINKELKAKKAEMLSIKKLNMMASRHNLKQPGQKQILVIP